MFIIMDMAFNAQTPSNVVSVTAYPYDQYNDSENPASEPRNLHVCWLTHMEDEPVVIMQSTGLTDKNGKEIFEGDVLAVDGGKIKEAGCFLVEWHEAGFHFRWSLREEWERPDPARQPKSLEIIGNIYENPELLPNACADS